MLAGQLLTLPAGVQRSGYSASTNNPYDPSAVQGDTNPFTTMPQAQNSGGGCGVLGQIFLAAIAIAVAVFLPPALGMAPGFVSGAVGGVAGSVVSQTVGLATGLQQKFSFAEVALSGLTGGIAGSSPVDPIPGLGKFGTRVLEATVGSFVSQDIGVITGLQSTFNWTGVAAAGVGAGVGAVIGEALHLKKISADPGVRNIAGHIIADTAAGIANAATRSLINGTDFGDNIIAALPDIVGNAVGSAVAGAVVSSHARAASVPWSLAPVDPNALDAYGKVDTSGLLVGLFGSSMTSLTSGDTGPASNQPSSTEYGTNDASGGNASPPTDPTQTANYGPEIVVTQDSQLNRLLGSALMSTDQFAQYQLNEKRIRDEEDSDFEKTGVMYSHIDELRYEAAKLDYAAPIRPLFAYADAVNSRMTSVYLAGDGMILPDDPNIAASQIAYLQSHGLDGKRDVSFGEFGLNIITMGASLGELGAVGRGAQIVRAADEFAPVVTDLSVNGARYTLTAPNIMGYGNVTGTIRAFAAESGGIRIATEGAGVAGDGFSPLLGQIRGAGGTLPVSRGQFGVQDIAGASRAGGNEIAFFRDRTTGQLYLRELGPQMGQIPENSRLILHTQPGSLPLSVQPSAADRAALSALGQRSSVIVNYDGTYAIRFRPNNAGDGQIRWIGN